MQLLGKALIANASEEVRARGGAQVLSSSNYLPFLDGLRAISILLVLGFHQLGPVSAFWGKQLSGWVGVDLFFIISGFLISSILLKESERTGSISLKNFYMRRWLRIAPAYYFFLGGMLIWMLLRGQSDYKSFVVAGLYLTNVDMCFAWGNVVATTGLLHTWSLSVEEQFYLFWPAVLKHGESKALSLCVFLLFASYLWKVVLWTQGVSWLRLSTGLDTKLDSIMLGVLVALLWKQENARIRLQQVFSKPFIQFAVVAALVFACHVLGHPATESIPLLFWGLKLPIVLLLMTVLVVSLLSKPDSKMGRFLSNKPLVWLGKLSYSLYLWHVLVNFPQSDALFQTVCMHKRYIVELAKFAAVIGLSALSYYLIETPFLKLKTKYS